jgi:hypothetical protein
MRGWLIGVVAIAGCASPHAAREPIGYSPGATQHDVPLRTPFVKEGEDYVASAAAYRTRVTHQGVVVLYAPAGDGRQAFTVETAAVTRGPVLLASGPAAPAPAASGTVRIERGAVLELVRTTLHGLSQSWVFGAAPPGRGDLHVHLEIAGAGPDAATILGEGAVWRDAIGNRIDVAVEEEGSDLVLRVPGAILDASSYPAVLETDGPGRGNGIASL